MPRLSGLHRRQQWLTLIVSWPFLSQLPHNHHLSPHYLTIINDSEHDFPWWQWQLPFITLQQQTQWWFPLHHFTNYNNPVSSQNLFHHLMTYDNLSPLPHNSPISLLPWGVSMLTQQEDTFAREQVCVTVTWQHCCDKVYLFHINYKREKN